MQRERGQLQERAGAEDRDCCNQTGQVFADRQDLAANGREQVEVQALIQHLAAEQVGEHAHTGKENRQPQVEKLEDAGEDQGVLGDGIPIPLIDAHQRVIAETKVENVFAIGVIVKIETCVGTMEFIF